MSKYNLISEAIQILAEGIALDPKQRVRVLEIASDLKVEEKKTPAPKTEAK